MVICPSSVVILSPYFSSSPTGCSSHPAVLHAPSFQMSQALLSCPLGDAKVDAYVLTRLRADISMQLNSMKNAAYAAGYVAGKGEVAAAADRRFA